MRTSARPRLVTASLVLVSGLLVLAGCALLFGSRPNAVITSSQTSGEVPLQVSFDGLLSFDPDGDIVEYNWDFGDGAFWCAPTVTHTFTHAGTYQVTLNVVDSAGHTGSSVMTIVAIEVEVSSGGQDGIVLIGEPQVQDAVRALDPSGAPIADIQCEIISSENEKVLVLSDSNGRFVPRTLSPAAAGTAKAQAHRSRVGVHGATATDVVLIRWSDVAGSSSQTVYEDVLPRDVIQAILERSYTLCAGPFGSSDLENELTEVIEEQLANLHNRVFFLALSHGEGAAGKSTSIVRTAVVQSPQSTPQPALVPQSVNELYTGHTELEVWVARNPNDKQAQLIVLPTRAADDAGNSAPTAKIAELVDPILEYSSVKLDGTSSTDPDEDDLSYKWRLVSGPGDTDGLLTDSDQAIASLSAVREGRYVLELRVHDGSLASQPAKIEIAVEARSNFYSIPWTLFSVGGWQNPLHPQGSLTTRDWYDYDSEIYERPNHHGVQHAGIDILGEEGDPVYAIADGVVLHVKDCGETMNMAVIVAHKASDGSPFFCVYGHTKGSQQLSEDLKREGAHKVERGQELGKLVEAGSPCHLHLGINVSVTWWKEFAGVPAGWGRELIGVSLEAVGWVDPFEHLIRNQSSSTSPRTGTFDAAPYQCAPQPESPGEIDEPGLIVDSPRPVLKWEEIAGVDSYEIFIRDVPADYVLPTITVQAPRGSYQLEKDLNNNTAYRWNMRAIRTKGESPYSERLHFQTRWDEDTEDTTTPSTPQGVSADALSATQVIIGWEASTDNVGVASYSVIRDGVTIASTAEHVLIDGDCKASTEYCYRIVAVDTSGNQSEKSVAACITTPADPNPAPTVDTRSAEGIGETSATLRGRITSDGGGTILERQIKWGTSNSCSIGTLSNVAVSGSYFEAVLSGLEPGETYYFKARARNSSGWGEGSAKSFTTDEEQVVVPSITSIDPATIEESSDEQTVIVRGTNFDRDAVVVLWHESDEYTIPDGRTDYRNSARIDIDVRLSDSGTWKVQVTNPDGKASNVYSFDVDEKQKAIIQVSVSNGSPAFLYGSNSGRSDYWRSFTGPDGHSYLSTWTSDSGVDCWARFRPAIPETGTYEVIVCFYADREGSQRVPYTVSHADGSHTQRISHYDSRGFYLWREVSLGYWEFSKGTSGSVLVTDDTGEPYRIDLNFNVDMVKFVQQ